VTTGWSSPLGSGSAVPETGPATYCLVGGLWEAQLLPLYQIKRRARIIREANESSTAATVWTRANLAALRAELAEQERLGGRAADGQQSAVVR
jgi:hypothetical protein